MTTTIMSSREFNQDASRAKQSADEGPVIVTERGEPTYVLLRYESYRRFAADAPSIRDLLAEPGVENIEFDPPRFGSR